MKEYKFQLFPLRFLSGTFDRSELEALFQTHWKNGFRFVKREFSLEPKKVFVFFQKLAFGILFEKNPEIPEKNKDVLLLDYKTRFFTSTIDMQRLSRTLNEPAAMGYDLVFGFKYPARFFFIFPRECYFFIFTKPASESSSPKKIHLLEHHYRLWTQTIDEKAYEADLNHFLKDKELKFSLRDEKRKFGGLLLLRTAVVIAQSG
ncbi:MAG: hypothetical protein H7A25_07835 [Leptospiraceae bacterium]|nr:hypothetical protein [Leptospiraceae bacterium]MCP5499795.1 hypothetical protein [Leptospiraceae bacterium]